MRHPSKARDAVQVYERMAAEGIVTLPGQILAAEAALQDDGSRRLVRFSIANVSDETVALVRRQLPEIEQRFGWELD